MRRTWLAGQTPIKCIGFDATEDHRVKGGGTYACSSGLKILDGDPIAPPFRNRYQVDYPLRDRGHTRAKCIEGIRSLGLPVPMKSCCFFCSAYHLEEITSQEETDPEYHLLALAMERIYRGGKHFRGDDVWTVTAKHKETGEKIKEDVEASTAAEARSAFRVRMKDTERPYQWKLSPSRAVPGLGRKFAWAEVSKALPIIYQ